jgi:hypothetical protein
MVKKIRLIDDEPETPSSTDSSGPTGGNELIELAKSMDWKLWEILQLMQRVEKKLTVTEESEEKTNAKSKK